MSLFHAPVPRPWPHVRSARGCTPERKHMQKITFPLQGHPHVELNQLLKLCGLCDSGGAGKQLVAEGHVRVDGKPESRKTCKITVGQKVSLGDVQITVIAE